MPRKKARLGKVVNPPLSKVWHVASVKNRESIQEHGINHNIGGSGSLDVFKDNIDIDGNIPRAGNYFFKRETDAVDYANPNEHDIWEVTIPESRQQAFHNDVGLPGSAYSPRPVPKKHLNLKQFYADPPLPPRRGGII